MFDINNIAIEETTKNKVGRPKGAVDSELQSCIEEVTETLIAFSEQDQVQDILSQELGAVNVASVLEQGIEAYNREGRTSVETLATKVRANLKPLGLSVDREGKLSRISA